MTPQILVACTGARIDRAQTFMPLLAAAMAEFGIDTPKRQAAFLAQVGYESGGLHWLLELWGPTPTQRNYEPPGTLAADLGNTKPGDGLRYRGRGLIQITGRYNYRVTGPALGADLETFPDLLAEPGMASRSAAHFWAAHNLNALADEGDFVSITKRINGGTNGLAGRVQLWSAAKTALGA